MYLVRNISSMELEEVTTLPSSTEASVPSLLPPDNKAQAYVNAGSLVIFSSRLTGQQKQDVLFSSLLAQLAANKKHDRFTDAENWYKFYTDVMGQLGWIMPQNLQFSKYESLSDFTISQVTLKVLSGLIGDETKMATLAQKYLHSLAECSDELTLFESKSASSQYGNFQLLVCDINNSNQVIVYFLFVYFHDKEPKANYFFVIHKKENVVIFKSAETLVLNYGLYEQIREQVKSKLGPERILKLIHNVAM